MIKNISFLNEEFDEDYNYDIVTFTIAIPDASDIDIDEINQEIESRVDDQYEVLSYDFEVVEAKYTYVFVTMKVQIEEESDEEFIDDILNFVSDDENLWDVRNIEHSSNIDEATNPGNIPNVPARHKKCTDKEDNEDKLELDEDNASDINNKLSTFFDQLNDMGEFFDGSNNTKAIQSIKNLQDILKKSKIENKINKNKLLISENNISYYGSEYFDDGKYIEYYKEELEFPLDCDITIDENGVFNYVDDKFAYPYNGDDEWYSDEYNSIVLCSAEDASDEVYDIIYELMNDDYESGTYHLSGDVVLVFNVNALFSKSGELYSQESEIEYNRDESNILNFKYTKID